MDRYSDIPGFESEMIELNISLKKDEYEMVERLGLKVGLGPSQWVKFAISGKLRKMVENLTD